jgi:hypothetical protein
MIMAFCGETADWSLACKTGNRIRGRGGTGLAMVFYQVAFGAGRK